MYVSHYRYTGKRLVRRANYLAVLIFVFQMVLPANAQWTQYGGSNHGFKAKTPPLANSWPTEGPRKLWNRELGDGFSTIIVDNSRLYTMYRANEKEIVICMSAENGETVWEYAYDSMPLKDHWDNYGRGPRATPLLVDGLIYSIGVAGMMHCLDAKDGSLKWSHDLVSEFSANVLWGGYSSSPIEHEGKIIVLSGGQDQSVIAFDKTTGAVVWKSLSFSNSYSTPVVLRIHGEDQIVALTETHVIGVDPFDGKLLWEIRVAEKKRENAPMPILIAKNTIMITARKLGTRSIRVSKRDGKFEAAEIWSTKKIAVYHGSIVLVDDHIYTSTGANPPRFIAALNIKTGKVAWRKRGFGRSSVVYGDGKLFILDANGDLALATATPDDLVIHSKVKMLENFAWASPTLAGRTLYLRDRKRIMALDVGK